MTVSCQSGGWACELKLAATELTARLNALGPPEKSGKSASFIRLAVPEIPQIAGKFRQIVLRISGAFMIYSWE